MIKITDGDKIISADPYINEDEILAAMTFLKEQIVNIDNYLERSLFFQNPQIIEGWLQLIRTISKIQKWEAPEDDEQWGERTETYVAYLLTMKEIRIQYQNICRAYYDKLKELMDCYGGWLDGDCISADGIETLCADHYEKDINEDDINRFLKDLNNESNDARSNIFNTLSDIYIILVAIINRGANIVFDLNPSEEDFAMAIDADLREWTLSFKEDMYEKMEEEMFRHYMDNRTDEITAGLWSKMLDADEEALRLAIRQELAKSDDLKQEHWGEDRKVEMDENSKLMQQIYSSCKNKELFDLSKTEKVQPFIDLLKPDNLSMFYDIIVRRSLIQCKMFPNLKSQHDEWLKGNREQQPEEDKTKEMTPESNPDEYFQEGTNRKEGESSLEAGLRRSIERLMQERFIVKKVGKDVEEPLFNLQNHWQGVYRILVDKKYCKDADFEGFDLFILKVMPDEVNKPYSKESVKQISKTDFNIPFERWEYNGETSGTRKVYERMFAVTKRFKEILEEEEL